MKVKELIEKLKTFNPEAEVEMESDNEFHDFVLDVEQIHPLRVTLIRDDSI